MTPKTPTNHKELARLLESGEGETLEFKRSTAAIHEAMKGDVLASKVAFSDDTPVRLLEPGLGKTR